MANSDQEADNSLQPKLFAVNQPPQEENKPLCRSDDEDLSSEAFTPKEFCHLNGGQETYEVLSFSNPREDGACLKDVADPSTAGVTHTPDSSETDSPSSNSSIEGSVEEAPPKSKCSGQDLNGGYCGDVDTELDMSGIHKLQNPQHGEYKPDYDFKVVTHAVLHRDFCMHVTRWPCNRKPLDLPRIYLPKTKVKICNCQLHCRGLDMDFYERNATFTAVIQLPPKLFDSIRELTIDIDVNVYEGRVGEPKVPLLSSAKQRIKANKETKGVVHIVVNKIVHLDKIVYSNRCPKHIGLEIKASLAVVNYSDSESSLGTPVVDSGCVDMSKSHSIGV